MGCTFWAIVSVTLSGCVFDGSVSSSGNSPSLDDASTADSDASQVDPSADASTLDAAPAADAEMIHSYVSYWSFDVDATDQMGAHNGTLTSGAAITSGQQGFSGEALELSEDGELVVVANPLDFNFNADFTWHFYMKTSDSSGALLSRSPPAASWNQGSKAVFVRNSKVQLDAYNVGVVDSGVDISDDSWHQVIVTFRESNDTLKIYVDPSAGNPSPAYNGTFNLATYDEHNHVHNGNVAGSGFSMGNGNSSGGLSSLDTMIGLIDEVAVFGRVIEGPELVQLINSGPSSF